MDKKHRRIAISFLDIKLGRTGGLEIHALELTKYLLQISRDYHYYLLVPQEFSYEFTSKNPIVYLRAPLKQFKGTHILFSWFYLFFCHVRYRFDVILIPNNRVPFFLPAKLITCIHDLYCFHPEVERNKFIKFIERVFYRITIFNIQ